MSANGKGATATVTAATVSQRPAVKPSTESAAKVVSQAKQQNGAKTAESEVEKVLDKMTAQQLCKELYSTSIKYGVIAMRLLAKTGSTKAAKREYSNFLKTMWPDFTVRGEETKKGERLYEPQRHYNNLDYYYRQDKDDNKGEGGRSIETSITMFLTACHKEAHKAVWVKLFVDALTKEERAAMKKLL